MVKTRLRKPLPFRSRNIRASTEVESDGKRTVSFGDRADPYAQGVSVPSEEEITRFTKWLKRARAWARQRNL